MKDFILKKEDAFTPIAISSWIQEVLRYEEPESRVVVNKAKIAKACRHLADILEYQYENGCRIPD